jgi:peroxiredoxin
MSPIRRTLLLAAALLTAPLMHAQMKDSAVEARIDVLRTLPADQRPAATIKIATDLGLVRASPNKVRLATDLASMATEGDQGSDTIQVVADALSQALAQSPIAAKNDQPNQAYMELASLARYENASVTLKDPLYDKASQILASNDAEVEKADFTLKDVDGKKITLSEFRGKIVMVNFWATWCPPCRNEMPDLETIYSRFKPQGLVVLGITDEERFVAGSFADQWGYNFPILLDTDKKVHKLFHVTGIPRTFIFGRDGKLLGETIDQSTQRQFLAILGKTDLHN